MPVLILLVCLLVAQTVWAYKINETDRRHVVGLTSEKVTRVRAIVDLRPDAAVRLRPEYAAFVTCRTRVEMDAFDPHAWMRDEILRDPVRWAAYANAIAWNRKAAARVQLTLETASDEDADYRRANTIFPMPRRTYRRVETALLDELRARLVTDSRYAITATHVAPNRTRITNTTVVTADEIAEIVRDLNNEQKG